MITNSETQEKSQSCSFRKISKPLMEKKRRARINVSLDQLKTLLEKHYSQNIRKRKLEKADILELTVKYMKTLQSSVQGIPVLKTAEYQTGFRSCLNGVSQFLLRSEEAAESLHDHLLRELARCAQATGGCRVSTADGGLASPARPRHRLPGCPGLSLADDGSAASRDDNNQAPKAREVLGLTPREVTPAQTKRNLTSTPQAALNVHPNRSVESRTESLWRPW
ncbi:transcription factor HES-3 [Rhinatrema bivittatum]|uniref:transcription factor HES-3 n=1 Tax=Rhinatrema bivittatum TaxID=194408 RepID=UPI001127C4A4|nr:transcription factor HES-3 [Rhinatrema bivittatum]